MQSLINRYIDNGFSDFKGLKVEGSVPITQEVINEFISETLSSMSKPSSKSSSRLDTSSLLKLVKKAEIKAEQGKITLMFEVAV